jgi:DNA-binding NarL/FixJ family response regulator
LAQAMASEVPLSSRETAILRHLVRGATNKEIASDLGLTEATVQAQLRQLYRKLGVKDRSQARIWARDNGIS